MLDDSLDSSSDTTQASEVSQQVVVAARLWTTVEREYGPVGNILEYGRGERRFRVDLEDGRQIELSWYQANQLCLQLESPDPKVLDRLRARNLRWAQRAEQVNGPSPHYTAVRRAMTPRHASGRQSRPGPVRSRGSKRSGRQHATSSRGSPGGDDDPHEDEPPGEPPRLELWWHSRFGSCTPNLLEFLAGGRR